MKILRIFLVVAVLFGMSGLAGCGGDDTTKKETKPAPKTEQPADPETTE